MLAKVYSAQVSGLRAEIVDVEVDIAKGLHSFTIVGLPDKAVEEARDRLIAAIKNSGFKSPQKSNKKIIVSLAPADLKKEGPAFDLAIALGFISATKEIAFDPEGRLFAGELALDGRIRAIKGALAIAQKAKKAGFKELYVPADNAAEAALVREIKVYGCKSLKELASYLSPLEEAEQKIEIGVQKPTKLPEATRNTVDDFSDIRGQETAKRGLEIAAAGGHNVAMSGPPGTGKTMLARAFAGILPPLEFEDAIEITGIYSVAGLLDSPVLVTPPFRSPHHTASYVSLVGGGAWPKPGEVTLAHRGVLFLDEFPEFESRVIEALRQPLEDRIISVARARQSVMFPAHFILVAAMNPCPCGYLGSRHRECSCQPGALARYRRKISGPIVDRIDLWLEVPQVDHEKLAGEGEGAEVSAAIRKRVIASRKRQFARQNKNNCELTVKELKRYAPLDPAVQRLLTDSAKRLNLSARAYHRVIKLARTIADLAAAEHIAAEHLLEALQYRPKQRY